MELLELDDPDRLLAVRALTEVAQRYRLQLDERLADQIIKKLAEAF
jgi:hypothetical protein